MIALALLAMLFWEPWKTYPEIKDESNLRIIVRAASCIACMAISVSEALTYLAHL